MSNDVGNESLALNQPMPTFWQRITRISTRLILIFAIFFVLHFFGFVGIVYVRRINNDPFVHPVAVSEVGEDRIKLKDGRLFIPYGGISAETKEKIKEANMRVDLEVDETNLVTIYGMHDIFVCGTGMPLITLPIIPSKIPKYNRTLLEIGELEGLPRTTASKGCPEDEQCGDESHG